MRPPRWAPLGALLAAVLLTSSCGSGAGTPAPGAPSAPPPTVDAALHELLPASVRESGRLRIVTEASYAPASSFAPDGRTIVGFEPDLGAALGAVLGVDVVFADHGFEELEGMVTRGEADLVMSSMTDTAQRQERLDFVNYFSAGSSIVVQRGNPAGITDLRGLCGRTVAVQQGTVQVDLLARAQTGCGTGPAAVPIDVRTTTTNDDALLELRTGRADAVLNDYPPAVALTTDGRTGARFQLASTTQYEPGLYGIGVAKDDPALCRAVAAALQHLVDSGHYAQVLERWGVQASAVRAVTVNAGSSGSHGA